MTNEQHAEILAFLSTLANQGKYLKKELAAIRSDVATQEALIFSVLARFDEL